MTGHAGQTGLRGTENDNDANKIPVSPGVVLLPLTLRSERKYPEL